jgi:hypothetical protein
MIKSWSIRGVGHVALMREKRNACRILKGKTEVDHWEETIVGERITLKRVLER